MRVKFTQERTVLDGEKNVVRHFRPGEVVELSTASARHFINRSVAVEVRGSVPSSVLSVAEKPATAEVEPPLAEAGQSEGSAPKKGRGRPRGSGRGKRSSSSEAVQASPAKMSSSAEEKPASSPSTTPTSSHLGQTSSTDATPVGGETTETPASTD